MAPTSPLLLMDVDGVLNPYPDCPAGFTEYEFGTGDSGPVRARLSDAHRNWLHELSEDFDLIWATGWGHEANRLLCPHFGLPELPVITFSADRFEAAFGAPAPVKVPAIEAFVGDRAVAWVDDLLASDAQAWAATRPHPTLLSRLITPSDLREMPSRHFSPGDQLWADWRWTPRPSSTSERQWINGSSASRAMRKPRFTRSSVASNARSSCSIETTKS